MSWAGSYTGPANELELTFVGDGDGPAREQQAAAEDALKCLLGDPDDDGVVHVTAQGNAAELASITVGVAAVPLPEPEPEPEPEPGPEDVQQA